MSRRLTWLWLLLPAITWGVFTQQVDQRRMIEDIDQGSVLAWAEHITGQDPNNMTSWDDFESVAVIPGTSNRADGTARVDDEVWVVVQRTVDGNEVRYIEQFQSLDWGDDPNYCWFVDCAMNNGTVGGTPGTPGVPAVPPTYTFTWFSEVANLLGIPIWDGVVRGMDAGVAVRDLGDNKVGLPYTGHPFHVGETIQIAGGSIYATGSTTVLEGTTANEIAIAAIYQPSVCTGTESVIRVLPIDCTYGALDMTTAGDMYVGGSWSIPNLTNVTKITQAGVQTPVTLSWPAGTDGRTVYDLKVTPDGQYIYLLTNGNSAFKFDLTTGAYLWTAEPVLYQNAMDIDADGNAYTNGPVEGGSAEGCIHKMDAATGALTELPLTGQKPDSEILTGVSEVHVNDVQGIVVGGLAMTAWYHDYARYAKLYNVCVRNLDGSGGATMLLGEIREADPLATTETICRGYITSDDDYIYVLSRTTIHKLRWDGATLTELDSVLGPAYICGIFMDLWGNLIAVNQDYSTPQTTLFYVYDTDLNLLRTVTNLGSALLRTWTPTVGDLYTQGAALPYGDRGTPEIPEVPAVPGAEGNTSLGGRNLCLYADGKPLGTVDPNTGLRATFPAEPNGVYDAGGTYTTVIAGLNYFSILETMPLGDRQTTKRPTRIKNVQVNFQDSMGAHIGANREYAADWKFSADDFNTPMAPFTGYKGPTPFLYGVGRQPVIYVWEECPVPLTIRSITANMEVTFE